MERASEELNEEKLNSFLKGEQIKRNKKNRTVNN
jgi:hypothetical protein